MTIHLRTLGHIHLRNDAGDELRSLLTQPKRLALLVYLASNGAAGMSRRDSLLAMFWPESDAEHARNSLRQAIHFIKQAAGSDVVVTRGVDELSLAPGAMSMDAAMLDELATAGRHEEVVAMYSGEFLTGFFVRGAPDFEHWADVERTRLRARVADSAWLVTEQRLASGKTLDARAMGARALALSSNNETAVRRFITLLAESGDRAAALAVFQDFAGQMAREYGVAPSPETRRLVERLDVADSAPHAEPLTVVAPPPMSPRASTTSFLRFGKRAALVGGVAAVLVAASVPILGPALGKQNGGSDPNRMVVLPFVVRGPQSLRYLEDGVPILLGTRLDGAGPLRTVDARALIVYLGDARSAGILPPEKAREVASEFGAQLYVLGSIVGTSERLRVNASLYDRSRGDHAIAHTEVEGTESDLVHVVDKLTTELLAARFHVTGGSVAEMAARTTSSLPALKAWLAGEAALTAGRYGPAMVALREAIAADSDFAMAHFRLAVAANWSGKPSIVDVEMQHAMAHADRTSPSTRLVMQAFADEQQGNYAGAERALRTVLAEQPSNAEAWYELGDVLFHGNPAQGRPGDESRDAFANALRLDPHNFSAMMHLSRIAAARSDAVELDRLSRAALGTNPDSAQRAELLLLRALSLQDDRAQAAFLAPRLTSDRIDALWRAAEHSGNIVRATTIADSLSHVAPVGELRASLHLLLAHLYMGRERFADADRVIDSVATHAPQTAAVTRLLLATHPALPAALRGPMLQRSVRAASPLPASASSRRINIGSSRADDVGAPAVYAVAFARAMLGDSSSVVPLATSPTADLSQRLLAARAQLMLASNATARASALRAVATLDSLCASQYTAQTPFAARALYHLAVARALEADGRVVEAERRLHALPEDFGFNAAYLGEVQRQRVALLNRLKRPAEAQVAQSKLRAMLK